LRLLAEQRGARLCVAGDLNTTVGFDGHYGTKRGRALLNEALEAAALVCVTRDANRPRERVAHPFIDHVCVSRELAGASTVVDAWEGRADGVKLSDHSGVVVEVP